MEEAYKEMFVHLYKTLEVLQGVFQKLSDKIDDSLGESTGIYLDHFNAQMDDNEKIKQQFADLLNKI